MPTDWRHESPDRRWQWVVAQAHYESGEGAPLDEIAALAKVIYQRWERIDRAKQERDALAERLGCYG